MPPSRKKPDVVAIFPNFDLHRACAAGNLGLVQFAINQGQPVNSVLAGVLPLHAAASGGNEQVVKTLILAGADVNAPRLSSKIGPPQDVGGIATVVGPSHKGRLGSANSASGQSVTFRPGSSSSARSAPSASVPTMGNRGSTPLHFAAALGHSNIVKILLDCGADPNARDCHKLRPIDAARTAGQSKTVHLLEEFEAHGGLLPPSSQRYPVTLSDFTSNAFGSTASLPGESVPAHPSSSTSSLGRYPAPQRRPSLPSIYESPPATAILTVKTEAPRPHPLRRPRSAGATATRSSSDTSSSAPISSRIGRIFKKTGTRPSTASATFQSPTQALPQANHERSQTTHHAHIMPSHTRTTIGKAIERSLQHHHLPVLHNSHTPSPHVSIEDISAPMAHVMGPSRSDLVHVRPDMNKPTASEPRAEGEFYKLHGGLSAVELHYATTRGMDPFRPIRTAPPTQTVFSFEPAENGQDPQMPKDLVGLPAVPRHRLGLAGFPDQVQTHTTPGMGRSRMDSSTTGVSGSSGMVTDGAVNEVGGRQQQQARRSSHLGLPSLSRTPHTAPPPVPNRSRGASVSSIETESSGAVQTPNSAATGSSSTNPETVPAESNLYTPDETSTGNTLGKPASPASSHEHSPPRGSRSMHKSSHSSLSKLTTAPPASAMRVNRPMRNSSPGGRGLRVSEGIPPVPPVDTAWVASLSQAKELVDAHRRAIESEHEERVKRKRGASGSNDHPPGSLGKSMHSPTGLDEQRQLSNDEPPEQPSEEGSGGIVLSGAALRERLAALGTTVQLERRFLRGEKQGKSWNRSIDATRGGCSVGESRAELLDKFFDPEGEEKALSDSQKMAAPPKKDVFGRPITPKEKGRPTTPKDMQTAALAKSPLPSRVLEAPRENRILPPPDKSVRLAGFSPAGAGHMPHRTRSDNTLPQVNREEVPARDRAWTTTDVRPRINPVSVRPELSPTIEIVQTSPTPTNGPSPVRQNMGQQDRRYVRDAIYVEDEHASVSMWEQHSSSQSKRSNRPSTAPLLSSGPSKAPERPSKGTRDAPASPRLYQSSLRGVPEVHVASTDPMAASHPQQSIVTTVSSLDSPTSSVEIDMGGPLMRITTEPLEMTPSAVDLHNLHFTMSGELENLSYMPPGVRIDNSGTYGFNGARGLSADRSWGMLGYETPSPPPDAMNPSPTKAKRITGFFSRKKR